MRACSASSWSAFATASQGLKNGGCDRPRAIDVSSILIRVMHSRNVASALDLPSGPAGTSYIAHIGESTVTLQSRWDVASAVYCIAGSSGRVASRTCSCDLAHSTPASTSFESRAHSNEQGTRWYLRPERGARTLLVLDKCGVGDTALWQQLKALRFTALCSECLCLLSHWRGEGQ